MAYRFEHDAPRVEPERREVGLRILRKHLWLVQDLPTEPRRQFGDEGVNLVDRRPGTHHEGQMLQAGLVPRVRRRLSRRIEEEVCPLLSAGRAIGELIVGVE